MRSKAPLSLIEQIIMLLVFALASALCLQAFVKSDRLSRRIEERSRAALAAQNAAELLKYSGGDMGDALYRTGELMGGAYAQGILYIAYDEDWNPTDKEGVYRLTAEGVPVEEPGLQKARIQVAAESPKDSEVLFELETAWLEVRPDE